MISNNIFEIQREMFIGFQLSVAFCDYFRAQHFSPCDMRIRVASISLNEVGYAPRERERERERERKRHR